jgi:predicted peptidase
VRLAAVALAFTLSAGALLAQPRSIQTGFLDRSVTVGGVMHRYGVYVPSDFTPDNTWPVLADLHGNGAQGDDGIRQTAHFLGEEIRLKRSRFPLIVVFPQAARGGSWTSPGMPEMVMAEIDAASAEFRGDQTRTYLTGFSMGADGVYAIGARWPGRFAALVAIAGVQALDRTDPLRGLRGMPMRVFQGAQDKSVPVERARQLVAALKTLGVAVDYTEYPDATHGPTAERAYADQSLLDWLLAQRRK